MTKLTDIKLNFYHYFLISFLIVFTINLVLNWDNFGFIVSLLKGDINSLMQFDSARFGRVFGMLAVETLALSGVFSFVSKKIV